MIAYNSNEGSRHTDVFWFLLYAADSVQALGQLAAIDYSDSTPDVAFTYDRQGRPLTITDILGTRTNVYDALNLLEERFPDGDALVRTYDAFGRAAGIALGPDYAVGYGYDSFGRFSTVAVSNGPTFTYTYLPGTSLLAGYTNTLGLSVAYEYEPYRDLKTLVSNAWGTNVISTFAYTYDPLGRRTQRVDSELTTNVFAYNPRSGLVSALMGTNSYSYAYDPIGNRTSSSENGLTTTYAANELNQYTALNPASTNPTPFTYDPDGNMTSDGTWSYPWDAENRLIEVQPLVTNLDSTLLQFMYDAQSRRIARREFAWNDYLGETTWHYVQGRAYRYDGWNLLQELKPSVTPRTPPTYMPQTDLRLTGTAGSTAARYVWGLDLSQSLQGAGGIGGLLMQRHSDTNSPLFSFCDANGNITDLLDEDGVPGAHDEYDGYGNTIVQAREQLEANSFGFSSKYCDGKISFYYYGHRYYCSQFGRWLSRDSLGEREEAHLYAFVGNNAIHRTDFLGMAAARLLKKEEIIDDPMTMRLHVLATDIAEGCELNFIQLAYNGHNWTIDDGGNSPPANPPFYYNRNWKDTSGQTIDSMYLNPDGSLVFEDAPNVKTYFLLFAVERCCIKYYSDYKNCNCCERSKATVLQRFYWHTLRGKAELQEITAENKRKMDNILLRHIPFDRKFELVGCEPYLKDIEGKSFAWQAENYAIQHSVEIILDQ